MSLSCHVMSSCHIMSHCYSPMCTDAPQVLSPELNMTGSYGDDLMMDCLHRGTPSPEIKWLHNDIAITTSDRYSVMSNGSLLISSLNAEDAGVWTCFVSNVLGQAQMDVNLTFVGDEGVLGSVGS